LRRLAQVRSSEFRGPGRPEPAASHSLHGGADASAAANVGRSDARRRRVVRGRPTIRLRQLR